MWGAYSAAVTSDSQTLLSVSLLDGSPLSQHCLFQEVEEWQWLWYLKTSYWRHGNNTDSIRNIVSLDNRYSRDFSAILCGAAVNHFDWLPFGYSLRAPVIVADTLATLKHSCCVIHLPQNSQNIQNFSRYQGTSIIILLATLVMWWSEMVAAPSRDYPDTADCQLLFVGGLWGASSCIWGVMLWRR